jgi:hypothetical protein
METVELMPHFFCSSENAGEMTEEPKELFELLDCAFDWRQDAHAVSDIIAGVTI